MWNSKRIGRYAGIEMPKRRSLKRLTAALLGAMAVAASTSSTAQFPEKPIRLIVPQAAGSATDNIGRLYASELGKVLNQQIVVENRPGGGFTIGLDVVAKAAPDGYTLGVGPIGAMAIAPNMLAKIPYSIERDFQPVIILSRGHLLLAASPHLQVNSVKELIEYAKKNPGKLSNASSATGSPGHVSAELFKHMAGIQMTHVPYKGGAMAINDLIAGNVHVMMESLNSISPHARSGKVKALAVSGARRSPAFPDVPTVAEAGVPGYDAPTWSGIVGPAGIPRPILDRLNAASNEAIRSQLFRDRFTIIGDDPAGGTPEDFAALIRSELKRWAEVVKVSGAKLE